MILYPSIDIRGGAAVRLLQGDYARETRYDSDPVDAAHRWAAQGAEWLHVVDLDGAKEGAPRNLQHVRRIAADVGLPVQLGGGLREDDHVAEALESGATRVVIGTAALRDPDFTERMVSEHGDRIAVGVDARGGMAAAQGWTEVSDQPAIDVIRDMTQRGVERFVWTPIEVDGTMAGPPLEELRELAEGIEAELIYSGGVGSLDHLRDLRDLDLPGVEGAIVGRALYEGIFDVADAIQALA